MMCHDVRAWLLQAERPRERAAAPVAIAVHLRECDDCRRLANRLEAFESAYREAPPPVTLEPARQAFLRRLAGPPLRWGRWASMRRFTPTRWALAASILLFVGVGTLLLWPAQQARASGDLVERLLDWNLDLAETRSLDERGRLHARQRGAVADELRISDLAGDDRRLAESLVETADWLTTHDEPAEEAERLNTVADQLLERMHAAAERGDRKTIDRFARQYRRYADKGVTANIERVTAVPALNFDHQRRIEKVLLRDPERVRQLEALLEVSPDPSRKEIRRALNLTKNRTKHKPTPGTGKRPGKG